MEGLCGVYMVGMCGGEINRAMPLALMIAANNFPCHHMLAAFPITQLGRTSCYQVRHVGQLEQRNDEPPAEVRRSPSCRAAGIELWSGFSRRKARILDR